MTGGLNKLLSTVCFHSIQLVRLFEGHWAECGSVFCKKKKKKKRKLGFFFLIRLMEKIIGQLIDY